MTKLPIYVSTLKIYHQNVSHIFNYIYEEKKSNHMCVIKVNKGQNSIRPFGLVRAFPTFDERK